MLPEFSPKELRETKPLEYLVRFAFGGAIAVAAFVVGEVYGPKGGGLFLAFPALLPAGLTLIKRHDGRRAAADDARGAMLGSVGMLAFAIAVWWGRQWSPWVCLGGALVAWAAISVACWFAVFGRRA